MINVPANMKMHPDIKVITHLTADAMTGDGVFADTDLVRINFDGYLLVNAVVTATGDSLVYVPQLDHKENRSNHLPVLNTGAHPAVTTFPSYKIRVFKGETPRILYDEVSDTAACFAGYFFKGLDNPVAMNTPDIMVVKNITATAQNALSGTELEDCPFPGQLLVWTCSDVKTATIQIQQAGHQTGNVSYAPVINSGLAVDVSQNAPFMTYVPATGNPTVTITIASGTTQLVACFFVDWDAVPKRQLRKMGF